jgi:hypothetical protein
VTVTVTVRNTGPAAFARLKANARPAIVRAINRAAVSARTAMVPKMAQDLGLKSSDIREGKQGIRFTQATPDKHQARLSASLKRIPLAKFNARGPMPSRGKGRGVTYKIGSGGRQRVPRGFLATMRSGHLGVYLRTGKARLPIRELFGPSIGRVFIKFRELGRVRALEALQKNLQSEFRFALSRAA